jgi:hypothetical protein
VVAVALVTVALATPNVVPLQATPCQTTPLAVVVNLDDQKNDDTIAHARAAVIAGKARVLHIARTEANTHRDQSLRGIPTKRGFDRDEYPPAASAEGGRGADVEYVESSDNRSAGSRMRIQLRPYCDGQAFILEPGTP